MTRIKAVILKDTTPTRAHYCYTINHPETGESQDFPTKRKAISQAKKEDYTPVFIDKYNLDTENIDDDIKVENPGKRIIE